jgi:hypothetical protein
MGQKKLLDRKKIVNSCIFFKILVILNSNIVF